MLGVTAPALPPRNPTQSLRSSTDRNKTFGRSPRSDGAPGVVVAAPPEDTEGGGDDPEVDDSDVDDDSCPPFPHAADPAAETEASEPNKNVLRLMDER